SASRWGIMVWFPAEVALRLSLSRAIAAITGSSEMEPKKGLPPITLVTLSERARALGASRPPRLRLSSRGEGIEAVIGDLLKSGIWRQSFISQRSPLNHSPPALQVPRLLCSIFFDPLCHQRKFWPKRQKKPPLPNARK